MVKFGEEDLKTTPWLEDGWTFKRKSVMSCMAHGSTRPAVSHGAEASIQETKGTQIIHEEVKRIEETIHIPTNDRMHLYLLRTPTMAWWTCYA